MNVARSLKQAALPPSLSHRLIIRGSAAAYVCLSSVKFDQMVADGRMPRPRCVDGRKAWDVRHLDLDRPIDGCEATVDFWSDCDASAIAALLTDEDRLTVPPRVEVLDDAGSAWIWYGGRGMVLFTHDYNMRQFLAERPDREVQCWSIPDLRFAFGHGFVQKVCAALKTQAGGWKGAAAESAEAE